MHRHATPIAQDSRKLQATFDLLEQGAIVGFHTEHSFEPVVILSTVASSVERVVGRTYSAASSVERTAT
jgi:hypothetical protein